MSNERWITQAMVVQLGRRASLIRLALTDGEWERAAARWLLLSVMGLLAGLAVVLFVVGA